MFLIRILGILVLLSCALFGQESVAVTFDPRETGELTLDWKSALIGLLLALACCGVWRLFMWLMESRRAAINWAKVRIWWPTAMVVWAWVLVAMLTRNESWGSAFDAVLLVFALLNFPVLVVVGLLAGLLNETVHAAFWVQLLVGSLAMWSGNYLFVRLAEWRAWINVPVFLHLSDPNTAGVNDVNS